MVVPKNPKRVISLCPSQTETLFSLGLGDRMVGRTRYCIHPASEVKNVQQVGGTKQVDLALVQALLPDLIIAEKEENPRELVEKLSSICPVFVTNVVDQGSALSMIGDLGSLAGVPEAAQQLNAEIQAAWNRIKALEGSLRVSYLIWKKPWMAVGGNTYINAVLKKVGLQNVFEQANACYPKVTLEELKENVPDIVLLSTEPYPFSQKHVEEVRKVLDGVQVLLTDGEMWSWYGSRMRLFPQYFESITAKISRTGG